MQKLAYLGLQRGNNGKPLFDCDFFHYMRDVQLICDMMRFLGGTLVSQRNP